MLNNLTIDGTILDKWRASETDITLKNPMFSINQTLFNKGLFLFELVPKVENALTIGRADRYSAKSD